MNNRQLFLAWMRTAAPTHYMQVLRKVTGKTKSLGGLGDDLTDSFITPDVQSSLDQTLIDPSTMNIVAQSDTSPTTGSDWWSSLITGVTNVAQTALPALIYSQAGKATGTSPALIALNAQRAQAGLPPVTATGAVVTANQLAPASPSLLAMEQKLAGGMSLSVPLLLLGGAAVYLLARR
jgi:hypothetical protein